MTMKCAIIGCGKRSVTFVEAMLEAGDTELVAAVDPFPEGREKIVEEFGGKAYDSTEAMLAEVVPDFVCLITRPNIRLEPIQACAEAGVKGFHSEKPCGISIGVARDAHAAATKHGMKLSYSHQRRFNIQFVKAKELIEAGTIGDLQHIDCHCDNLYDWGTHWFDMMHYFNGEAPAEWLIAQAQRSDPKMVFDQPMDRCGISAVKFSNGVTGTMHTGEAQVGGFNFSVKGSDGYFEIKHCDNPPTIEVWNKDGYQLIDLTEDNNDHGSNVKNATIDAIQCVREDRESRCGSRFALAATELIFASYASAMRGEKITIPMDGDLSLQEIFDT